MNLACSINLDFVSPPVRRRAILALRSLAVYEPSLLSQGSDTIIKRMQDRNESVASSALATVAALPTVRSFLDLVSHLTKPLQSDPKYADVRHVVNGLFSSIGISSGSAITLRILQCLQSVGYANHDGLVQSFRPICLLACQRLTSPLLWNSSRTFLLLKTHQIQ